MASTDQASSGPAVEVGLELVDAAHAAAGARGDDDRIGEGRRHPSMVPCLGASRGTRAPVGSGAPRSQRDQTADLGEDHPSRDRLEHAGHDHVDLALEVPLPPSTTIIVPSSRNADALAGLLALLDDPTRISSPGRNAGFIAFASWFRFITRTPWSCATRLRL